MAQVERRSAWRRKRTTNELLQPCVCEVSLFVEMLCRRVSSGCTEEEKKDGDEKEEGEVVRTDWHGLLLNREREEVTLRQAGHTT
jgi:hypothetical protein